MLDRLTDNELADVAMCVEKTVAVTYRLYHYIHEKAKSNTAKLNQLQAQLNDADKMFIFKGNIYDLSYFWGKEKLLISDLETIPTGIRDAVKNNFNQMAKDGLITRSADKQSLELTEAGKKMCNDKEFIDAVCRDRLDVCNDIKKVVVQEQKNRGINIEQVPNVPTINFNDNMVANANEISIESAKKAAGTAAQKTAGTAAKQTAGAAAGAATAGIATAAQVAYELAAGGIKKVQEKIIQ